jgi:hypothetical protein
MPSEYCRSSVRSNAGATKYAGRPFNRLTRPTEIAAERRRQAVAAVLFRHSAQRPQRVPPAFRQRHKALAAEHHMGMLEARERQPELVEPVIERKRSLSLTFSTWG